MTQTQCRRLAFPRSIAPGQTSRKEDLRQHIQYHAADAPRAAHLDPSLKKRRCASAQWSDSSRSPVVQVDYLDQESDRLAGEPFPTPGWTEAAHVQPRRSAVARRRQVGTLSIRQES